MRRVMLLGAVLAVCGACAARGGKEGLLQPLPTIPLPGVEGRFDHFAADIKGGRLFLSALGNNTLEVLDTKAGKRLRSVPGMKEPQGVAYAPDLNRVFVGNGEGGACDILDGASLSRVGRVDQLEDADNVRYDVKEKRVYVGYGNGALCVIDGASGRRENTIRLAGHPESFQLEKNGARIWVNVPGAHQIAVVDRKQGKVIAAWPVTGAAANFPMAVDEEHHRLFIGCRQPARLLVYDTESGKQVAAQDIVGDTDDLFYEAARKRLYVAGGEGKVTVLEQRDADRYEARGQIPTAAGARTAFLAPEWGQFFVAVPHRGRQGAEVRVFATHR